MLKKARSQAHRLLLIVGFVVIALSPSFTQPAFAGGHMGTTSGQVTGN